MQQPERVGHLTISRKPGEALVFTVRGVSFRVEFREPRVSGRVEVVVEAPQSVDVLREELT